MKLIKKLEGTNIIPLDLQFFADEGGDDKGTTGTDAGTDGEESKKEDKKEEKTFTQEQVNRMMAKEKKQGKSAAFKELGIDDDKAFKSQFEAFQKFMSSQKTTEEQNEESNALLIKQKEEAERKVLFAEAKVEALKLEAKPECVEDVVILATARINDGEDMATVISEIKQKHKFLFGAPIEDDADKKKTGTKGTGSNLKTGSNDASGDQSMGQRLAARRKATNQKSVW